MTFLTQVSSDSISFDSFVTVDASSRIGSAQKRYIRDKIIFNVDLATKTPPIIYQTNLLAATTGQFRTQCIQPDSAISAWGILSCAQTLTGQGSHVFFATSAVSCAALTTSSPDKWTSITNNGNITIATNTALYVGFGSLLTSATEQAQIDACTVYWNSGVVPPPVWSAYDSIKNAIYWTAAINNSSTNNRVLKFDLNNPGWFPFSLNANALKVIDNSLYFGSSTGANWIKYGTVNNDDGAAINAYWKSKDFAPGSPFQEKNFQKISLVAQNEGSGSLNVVYALSNTSSGTFTVNLGTSSTIQYIRRNYNVPLQSQQTFMSLQFGNNAANQPFEILGAMVDYFMQPWRPITQ